MKNISIRLYMWVIFNDGNKKEWFNIDIKLSEDIKTILDFEDLNCIENIETISNYVLDNNNIIFELNNHSEFQSYGAYD